MSDKQIAQLNIEIANLEDERNEVQQKVQSANTQYIIGTIGAVIGLLLILFTNYWWLGALLVFAGALAVFTQGAKKRSAKRQVDQINQTIKAKRNSISEMLQE